MLAQLNKKLWDWLTVWNVFLAKMERDAALQRDEHRLLVFFHGYSLAHVIRPLVVARALRQRGYEVLFAGRGPHAQHIADEGFPLYDVETMPQQRMDEHLARGVYEYYDDEWIRRCVEAEQALVRQVQPSFPAHRRFAAHVAANGCLRGHRHCPYRRGVQPAQLFQRHSPPQLLPGAGRLL